MRVCKREEVKEVLSIFNEYVKPFLEEEERKKSDIDKGSKKDPVNKDDDNFSGTNENEKQKLDNNTLQTKHLQDMNTPIKRGIEGLVDAFRELFLNGHWKTLFDDISKHTNSQHLSTECIMEIVKKAFKISKIEAANQISFAGQCAKQIVETGETGDVSPDNIHSSKHMESSDELLRRYRYIHADMSTERLQGLLLQEVKTFLLDTYNIKMDGNKNLVLFTRDCAAITWLMCVEDPPIDMVYDKFSDRMDENKYDIIKGKPFKNIVWPALQFEGAGSMLSKGVIWC
ncbi:uncharacterized protein LOC132749740 [Ruditapes philippinarum]|uniref:uncharacterized protein LOC132749740 n=1 Tax=Ruditapes philippinarum TaxID=129788 RepID=UPI00295AFDEB|nr:uncharacterized protein LOC132749740 [Ruditapes philippinarum]